MLLYRNDYRDKRMCYYIETWCDYYLSGMYAVPPHNNTLFFLFVQAADIDDITFHPENNATHGRARWKRRFIRMHFQQPWTHNTFLD